MPSLSRRQFVQDLCCSVAAVAGAAAVPARAGQAPQAPVKGRQPYPFAVTVGPKGAVFVMDKELKKLYRLEDGNRTEVYTGSFKYRTPLYNVMAMTADSAGNLFFCDTGSMDVWRMSPDGKLAPLTGEKIARGIGPAPANQAFDVEAAYAGKFDKPMGVAIEPDGNLVVADLGLAALFRILPTGGEPQEIARVPAPHGVAIDRDGSFVVVSQGKDALVRVSAKGEVTPIVKGRLAASSNPHYVLVDQSGYVVSDNYAAAIWRVSPDGQVKAIAQGPPFNRPVGLAAEADGNLLVTDPHARKLFRVSRDGKVSEVASFESPADAQPAAAPKQP